MRRRFNSSERTAAYIIADGKCEDCGVELQPGWHGDHGIPFSLGGPTNVMNIQALCPPCNWKKGNRMTIRKPLRPWPQDTQLRGWQDEAYLEWVGHARNHFLCEAWPGTGKTVLALYIAYKLYEAGSVDFIIVVVPSTTLRKQWADSARDHGIDLDYEFENKAKIASTDFQGIVVTDASVYSDVMVYAKMSNRRCLVILDECHHGGIAIENPDGWGYALDTAFQKATYILSLSGTPFRSDSKRMPFVIYDETGKSVPDYSYGYGKALGDGVVRKLFFPRFEGDMSWLDGDDYYEKSFAEEINKRQESNRLKTALTKGTFVADMVQKMHADLMVMRSTSQPDAALLIKAIDTAHAAQLAKDIRRLTGCDPVVVHTKTVNPHEALTKFKTSADPYLIAVDMVTEGYDCPRLRFGIYASNVVALLSVIQFLGRFIRLLPKEAGIDDWSAHVAFPSDRRLIKIIETLKQQRNHILEEEQKRKKKEPPDDDPPPRVSTYVGHDASSERDGFIWDDRTFTQALVEKILPLKDSHGDTRTDEQYVAQAVDILNALGITPDSIKAPNQGPQVPPPPKSSEPHAQDLNVIRNLKKNAANKRASYLDYLRGVPQGTTNTEWKNTGRNGHDCASIADIKAKAEWIESRIAEELKNAQSTGKRYGGGSSAQGSFEW